MAMRLVDIDPKRPIIRLTLPIAHANCFLNHFARASSTRSVIEGQSMSALTSRLDCLRHFAERTAMMAQNTACVGLAEMRGPNSRHLRNGEKLRRGNNMSMVFGLQGNDCDDSHLVGIPR